MQYATGNQNERATRSPALQGVLGRAQAAAGHEPVTTGHVLAALTGDPDSQGGKVLASLGVSESDVAGALARIPLDDSTDASGPPRWFEIRMGGRTTTVEDPELARVLHELDPQQLRALLRTLTEEKAPGEEPD